jgi:hypothetical protein
MQNSYPTLQAIPIAVSIVRIMYPLSLQMTFAHFRTSIAKAAAPSFDIPLAC